MKKQKHKNFIVIISGVSGSGKGTLLKFLKDQPDHFVNAISCTTRAPREGEKEGYDYFYLSDEQFDNAIKNNEFIEWEPIHSQRSGRRKADMERYLSSGKIPVMEIDVKGMLKFKKMFDIISIFITPPSIEETIKRLKDRNTETQEEIEIRKSRYQLEMSYKDKYDYILINDDLGRAKEELLQIIEKEKEKRTSHNHFKNALLIFTFLFTFASSLAFLASEIYLSKMQTEPKVVAQSENINTNVVDSSSSQEEIAAVSTPVTPQAQVKDKIVKAPPKHETSPASQITSTAVANDGSKTVVVNTAGGNISSTTLSTLANINIANPGDIVFKDETASHSDLEPIIKNYLSNSLLWKSEIFSMKEIVLKDAGNTGWCGLYSASYKISESGQVSNVVGTITLNANIDCSYSDAALFNDYMKLYFSHEYGHHYTLYHKWIDLHISADQRFPDEYYSLRPLDKTKTAIDYSLGWENCEAEVIAEDYSYFYSGYGLQTMHDHYGLSLPSDNVENWLSQIGETPVQAEIPNLAPVLSITSPAESAVLSGNFTFGVNATDDNKVKKVSFYIDDLLITTLYSAPFSISVDPSNSSIGAHILKAVANDGTLDSVQQMNVSFVDNTKPELSVLSPETNPYESLTRKLDMKLLVKDNFSVDKVEVYLKNEKFGTWLNEEKEIIKSMSLTFSVSRLNQGENIFLIKAYDTSGNFQEINFTVNKK